MRKSRFLLSLIAATAIGLSVVGCDSSSSGSIADTTDLSVPNNNNSQQERQNLREYMLVGQRGLIEFSPTFGPGQSAPADAPGPVVAAPGDSDTVDPAQLYELAGIADTPAPNAFISAPGNSASEDPSVPGDQILAGTTGFHEVLASPTGSFAIGISRAKNRGFAGDSVSKSTLQIFALEIESPLDQVFPPNIIFAPVADPTSVLNPAANQGDFVSGAWSTNAAQFYASVSNTVTTFSVDGTIGRLDVVDVEPFPTGTGGVINNAAKLIPSRDGQFVYAIDNANAQMVTFSRDPIDGTLTQVATSNIVSDPRGATVDRSGKFMYIVGRASEQVAGYSINPDGSLTPFDLFPDQGVGPVPFNFGEPLGDIAANPQGDTLVLSAYSGALQTYTINATTGALSAVGGPAQPLGNARNSANIEFEPTGRFVVVANEHDFESLQSFVAGEENVFANLDSANNGTGQPVFSPDPQFDALNRIVYALPNVSPFTGDIQEFRIQADGTPRAIQSIDVENPYGLSFFQKVLQPPAGDGSQAQP
jgi:hypothetical protein